MTRGQRGEHRRGSPLQPCRYSPTLCPLVLDSRRYHFDDLILPKSCSTQKKMALLKPV